MSPMLHKLLSRDVHCILIDKIVQVYCQNKSIQIFIFHKQGNKFLQEIVSHSHLCFKVSFDSQCIIECCCLCFLLLIKLCLTFFDSSLLFIIFQPDCRVISAYNFNDVLPMCALLCIASFIIIIITIFYFNAIIFPKNA